MNLARPKEVAFQVEFPSFLIMADLNPILNIRPKNWQANIQIQAWVQGKIVEC